MTKKKEQYILRTCDKDLKAFKGFKWPRRGKVTAPDWENSPGCGHGLHGALWGEGNGRLFNWYLDAVWQVIKVTSDEIVDLDGKVKFESGYVVFTGDRKSATDKIIKIGAKGAVIGAMLTVGDLQSVMVGYGGTASAGDCGTASAGDRGTASSGHGGTASAGDCGTASSGHGGTASAGDRGKASAGYEGIASTGDYGKSSAGDRGTASAGNCGTASAGDCGRIQIDYYDVKTNRRRTKVGYIGEEGLKPNTLYSLNDNNEFEEVETMENKINYVIGNALEPDVSGNKIIAHICNNVGAWGAGFVVAISKKWPGPEQKYREWATGDLFSNMPYPFKLGQVQYVTVDSSTVVANMIAQDNIASSSPGHIPIRYDELEKCLNKVAKIALKENRSVHMPRVGCGIAGGSWAIIEQIINRSLVDQGVATYVYTLPGDNSWRD